MNVTWHLIPIIAVISTVYGATRYEQPAAILRCSLVIFLQVLAAFAIVLAGLFVLSYKL